MLNEEDTLALLRRAKGGDTAAKEELLQHNTCLLKSILKRYLGKGVEYDDLFQLAGMGFLKAIAGFDERFGVRFSTYAVPMIEGEIKRFLRDDGAIKVSRMIKRTARDINAYIERRLAETGEQPSVKELAQAFRMEESEVVFTLGSSRMPLSIYEQGDRRDERSAPLAERLPSDGDPEALLERVQLKEAIGRRPAREKKIVFLRYFRDMTQSEVARRIGVSQVQISRIESKIMSQFREQLQ